MWEFMKKLNEEGTTIILTTHYLEEAEQLCKNIAIINHGEIVINTSVRELLSQLGTETFVFDLESDLESDAAISVPALEGYEVTQVADDCLEVTVAKGQGLNQVVIRLNDAGIQVRSMRAKANRLEELFVGLIQKHKGS